jgi:hypothetical protein
VKIHNRDISDCIVKPKAEETTYTPSENDDLVFTMIGKGDETVDENGNCSSDGYPLLWDIAEENKSVTPAKDRSEAYARSIKGTNGRLFYVKRDSKGGLYDPIQTLPNSRHAKSLHKAENSVFMFKQVSHKVFSYYLNYLKTKNASWLKNAQRELN